jgi:hypothetical protein
MLIGAQVSGALFNRLVGDGEPALLRYQDFWLIPCIAAAVVMAPFFALFRHRTTANAAGAARSA